MEIRKHLIKEFNKLCSTGENVIRIQASLPGLFKFITNPNEFAGPIVEAWAHINFPKFFEKYEPAQSGQQEFFDAKVKFSGKDILINVKAKSKEKETRSRINLSSFSRFTFHYSNQNYQPYYIIVFSYSWNVQPSDLIISIDKLIYCFDLLDIPKENYKIEGASEGSFRIFISPIPEIAKTDYGSTFRKMSPRDFVNCILNLKESYLNKKREKRDKLIN